MTNQTMALLTVLAIMASSLWTTAYLTMMVSYTELVIFALVYAATITVGLLIVDKIRKI